MTSRDSGISSVENDNSCKKSVGQLILFFENISKSHY